MRYIRTIIAAGLAVSVLYAGGPMSPVSADKKKPGGNVPSTKCKVTAGPNKGKVGNFTEGGQWCEGTWGGTECKDNRGHSNGKCAAAAKVRPGHGWRAPVRGQLDRR